MENKFIYSDLGLTEKQQLVYDHLLHYGPHSVSKLGQELKIPRGVVFFLIKQLIEKGIVEKSLDHNGKKGYAATHPENLLKIIHNKAQDIERSRLQLEAALPQLINNYTLASAKPGVVYFEGPKEFQLIYDDIIRVGKDYKDIYPSSEEFKKFRLQANTKDFLERKNKANIKSKRLNQLNEEVLKEYTQNPYPLQEVRFVPKDKLVNPSEIIIYGTKVVLISFNPSLLATVIDNPDINKTFNQIFDYIWETTAEYHDQVVEEYELRTKN